MKHTINPDAFPSFDLVVTRHPALLEYLREVGLITAKTPCMAHVGHSDVKGKHVLGVLPHHLSALCASITEVPMRLTADDRQAMQAGDLTLDRVRDVADVPETYQVFAGGETQRAWAIARAHEQHRDGVTKNDMRSIMIQFVAEYALGTRLWDGKILVNRKAILAAACMSMSGQTHECGPTMTADGVLRHGWGEAAPVCPYEGTIAWSGDGGHAAAELDCDRWAIRCFGSGPEWCDWYQPGI